jgi:hypothetical protein
MIEARWLNGINRRHRDLWKQRRWQKPRNVITSTIIFSPIAAPAVHRQISIGVYNNPLRNCSIFSSWRD